MLRLGLHYHTPFLQKPDGLYMPGAFGRFVDGMANVSQKVTCLLHEARPSQTELCDYRIQSENISLVNLGQPRSVPYRTLFASRFIQRARPAFDDMDILLLRGPSPLLPQLARAARIPIALLLVGDYLAGIDDLPQPRWRMELIRLWARFNARGQMQAARRALVFVNSRKLFDRLQGKVPNLHLTQTTTLSRDDFFERPDTCQARPVRLLYTGRLSEMKGLFDIVSALAILVQRGEDATLDLVGAPDPGEEDIAARLARHADGLGLRGRVHFVGHKALGAELFDCYRAADIYVTASRLAEGFPRTLWEAMANSLPIAATRVGSIPDFAAGAAELSPPRDPSALADALARLIHDGDLRRQRIAAGQRLARQNTLERRAREMMDGIEQYLEKH